MSLAERDEINERENARRNLLANGPTGGYESSALTPPE